MTNKPTISAAEITKALDFRYACKEFDADKKDPRRGHGTDP